MQLSELNSNGVAHAYGKSRCKDRAAPRAIFATHVCCIRCFLYDYGLGALDEGLGIGAGAVMPVPEGGGSAGMGADGGGAEGGVDNGGGALRAPVSPVPILPASLQPASASKAIMAIATISRPSAFIIQKAISSRGAGAERRCALRME